MYTAEKPYHGHIFTKNTEAIISLYNGKVDDLGNRWFIGKPLSEFYDYKKDGIWQANEADLAKSYGSRVGQIKVSDINGDGKSEVVLVPGPGGAARTRILRGADLAPLEDFYALDPQFSGGAFVG